MKFKVSRSVSIITEEYIFVVYVYTLRAINNVSLCSSYNMHCNIDVSNVFRKFQNSDDLVHILSQLNIIYCTYYIWNIINVYNMCSFNTLWKLTEWAGPAEPDCWWCLPWYLCLLEEWILSEIRSGVPWANMATKFKLNIRYVLRQIMPAFCKPQICDCFISRIFVLVRKGCRTIFVSN